MFSRLTLFLLLISAAIAGAHGASAAGADSVSVRTGEHAAYSRIVFDWDAPVASELTRTAEGMLILTFGRAGRFDLSEASTAKLKRVGGLAPLPDGMSIQIAVRGDVTFKMLNYDNTVVVDVISPRSAVDIEPAANVKKKETIKTTAATAKLEAAKLTFRRAEDLQPAAANSGESAVAATTTEQPATPAPGGPLTGALPSPLFDIAGWRGGPDFLAAYRDASAELGAAENPETLLQLARLQFAWRHGDEALAMLRRLAEINPALARRVDVAALNEAVALTAGRTAALRNVFSDHIFDGSGEALLWRGAAKAAEHQWQAAADSFAGGLKHLESYPEEFRAQLALTAAEAGFQAGDTALSRKALDLAADALTDPAARAQWNAFKGLQLVQDKDPESAEPYLAAAAASLAPRARVMAQLALLDIGLASGKLSTEKAAVELEGLTYVWQGDALQLAILDRLIDTQASLGRYDRALEAADGAVLASPDLATQRIYRNRIGELLQRALDATAAGGGDRINAIALFDRYAEMLPDGAQHTDLGLKLADQLAAADLQGQAADLLQQLKRTAEPGNSATMTAATAGTGSDPDGLWRDKRWSEAADGYLTLVAEAPGSARPRLILRAAAALLLAGRNRELASLGANFGGEMGSTPLADPFKRLTAPGADYSVLIAPEMAQALTVSQ